MLYRSHVSARLLPLLLLSLTIISCGEDEATAPIEYPVLLEPVEATNQSGAQVYIPKNDGWLEIPSSRSRLWNDSAFEAKWYADSIPHRFRLLSENTWEYGHQGGGPFEYVREGEEWTFFTNDTNVSWYATGTSQQLRFFFSIFIYVPGDIVRVIGYDPGERILTKNAEEFADTIAYVTFDLIFEPEGGSPVD